MTTTALNAVFAATIADLGMEDRTANEILGRALPPKLMTGLLIAEAAQAGEVNVTHLDAIMGAYYGNQLPASITVQKSKFKTFLDGGVKQAPVATMLRRVAEMVEAKRAVVAAMGQGKDRDREQKACDKYSAGIFEKGVSLARAQSKKGTVLLDDAEINAIMSPDAKISDDPLLDGLEALLKGAEKLNGTSPFIGYDAVTAAIAGAIASHHAKINAGAPVTPQSEAPVSKAVTTAPIVAAPNNVVMIPAAKTVVIPADVELDELLAVG